MTPDPEQTDQRKGKILHWQGVKLSLAHPKGSTELKFAASFRRGPDASGRQWLRCAVLAGLGRQTQVHGVGDGATWISNPIEQQFGAQGSYPGWVLMFRCGCGCCALKTTVSRTIRIRIGVSCMTCGPIRMKRITAGMIRLVRGLGQSCRCGCLIR